MGKRLYIGNLSYQATEDSLRSAFEQGGRKVTSVSIVTDRDTGRSRGFAFVEMESPEEAEAAIAALDGTEVDGRAIRVSEARERPERNGGHGGDRGGSGRGRREQY